MQAPRHGHNGRQRQLQLAREETIRSKTPDGVRQELWAIALAYNLVRLEMERAALVAGVAPVRISGPLLAEDRFRPTRWNCTPAEVRPDLPARREDQDEQLRQAGEGAK